METNPEKLSFLLDLLDDDSPLVRRAVVWELAAFGSRLFDELHRLPVEITPKDKLLLNQLLAGSRKSELKRQWSTWFNASNDYVQLEEALTLLSEYLSGLEFKGQLKEGLDALAQEYRRAHSQIDAYSLADFLFKEKRFTGAQNDYYNPNNSNLIYVLKKHRGIPISLSCVFMLVGYRLGLKIRGCNSPRHFLAIVENGTSKELVDCFQSGKVIGEKDIATLSQESSLSLAQALKMEIGAMEIVRRVLGNLIFSYQQAQQNAQAVLMVHLLKEIQMFLDRCHAQKLAITDEKDADCFRVGQKVRFVDDEFSGLIVDYDLYCANEAQTILDNESQDLNQPWYRILVHQSNRSIYVAHSQVELDLGNWIVENPFVLQYFTRAHDGSYVRNHMPWIEDS